MIEEEKEVISFVITGQHQNRDVEVLEQLKYDDRDHKYTID
jgi:hypothetical protein